MKGAPHMQVPAVAPAGSAQVFILPQSASESQLVLHAPAVASQAYDPHDVIAPDLQFPFMQVAAAMSLPLLPSHDGAAQVVPSG